MNRVKSAFVSDRGRLDAGHLAERILASNLFAVLSIALKSERDISDASKTPGNRDLKGKTSHPLVPPDLLNAFFFLYTLERKITEGKKDQQHMPMPTGPASAFMVIQSQLFFQLLVALFNPETAHERDEPFQG